MGELIPYEQPVVSPPQDVAGEPVTATPPSDENPAPTSDVNAGSNTNPQESVTESAISQGKEEAVVNPNMEQAETSTTEATLPVQEESLGNVDAAYMKKWNDEHGGGADVVNSTSEALPQLTFGEKLVGKTFNPSNNPDVDKVKSLCAELANLVVSHDCSNSSGAFNVPFYQGALDRILDAQMWSVKYLTNQY